MSLDPLHEGKNHPGKLQDKVSLQGSRVILFGPLEFKNQIS